MILNFSEILDLFLMTIYLGIIFSSLLKGFTSRVGHYNPLERKLGFDFKLMKFSILLIGPAIVLHELAHKFVAMGFGIDATFMAFYRANFTLILGLIALVMALANTGFVFLVPGFVSIGQTSSPGIYALIAFAGPFMNLLLWVGAAAFLKYGSTKKKYVPLLVLTKKINMFLFFFNMLPIPGFDGSKVFSGLAGLF